MFAHGGLFSSKLRLSFVFQKLAGMSIFWGVFKQWGFCRCPVLCNRRTC